MSDERLQRIEDKLDGLVSGMLGVRTDLVGMKTAVSGLTGELADLRTTAGELTVGQATLEFRFDKLGHEWVQMERHLLGRIDDHERRITALESR